MIDVLLVVLGVVLGAAGSFYYFTKYRKPKAPPPPPAGKLLSTVRALHEVFSHGFGTVVTSLFDDIWRAAELKEIGVPKIDEKGRL